MALRVAALLVSSLLSCAVFFPGEVTAVCPEQYVEIADTCFHFFDNLDLDYLDARVTCQEFGGDLAVIKDCSLLKEVVDYIEAYAPVTEGYWIGATDIVVEGSWRWTDGSYVELGAPFWGRVASVDIEPSGIDEYCVMMDALDGFYFNSFSCAQSTGMAPLCQFIRETNNDTFSAAPCPNPYMELDGECLQFVVSLEESWEDARAVCGTSGGDLAVIDNCDLMHTVVNHISSNDLIPSRGFWIGGFDEYQTGQWGWINESPMSMGVPFWGRSGFGVMQPSDEIGLQNCAELWAKDRYYFNDVECVPFGGRSPLCQTARISGNLSNTDFF